MSWSDIYPILDDEMVEIYAKDASDEEKRDIGALYRVSRKINLRCSPHIVSYSLFWKSTNSEDPELPEPSIENIKNAEINNCAIRHDPWSHYIQPLLKEIPRLVEIYPDITFRVYLASDMSFLTRDLIAAGCEIFLMETPSIRHAPGCLWRYLAFEEQDRLITVADIDLIQDLPYDIERTRTMNKEGLGMWRSPISTDSDWSESGYYLPIIGNQMGVRGGVPMTSLLEAFTWHNIRGSFRNNLRISGCEDMQVARSQWPNYGFDEWFLAAAVYPRMAREGIMTFATTDIRSMMFTMDIEYVTWANSKSQLLVFPASNCC